MLISLYCADFPETVFIFGDFVPRTGEQIEIDYEDKSYTFEITSVTYIAENLDSKNKSKLDFTEVKVIADLIYSSAKKLEFYQVQCHDEKFNKGFEEHNEGFPRPENDPIKENGWNCADEVADLLNQIAEIKDKRNQIAEIKDKRIKESRSKL